jgi:WD40 repeat protein
MRIGAVCEVQKPCGMFVATYSLSTYSSTILCMHCSTSSVRILTEHYYMCALAVYMLTKQGVLVASLREHTAAVNRLAVTQDQSFFASASSDGTCKVGVSHLSCSDMLLTSIVYSIASSTLTKHVYIATAFACETGAMMYLVGSCCSVVVHCVSSCMLM